MKCIAYTGGYKYQLKEPYCVKTDVKPALYIYTEYISLDTSGNIIISEGYAWDGPSGPTVDTLNFMRGSLVHDALYQLMRERYLDHIYHREASDRTLQRLCLEDGMSSIRAWGVYHAVRLFADPAASPSSIKPIIYAPDGCQ